LSLCGLGMLPYGVVRSAEWAVLNQGRIRRKLVRHRVNTGDVQGLVDGHARQDARHGARQQGLAGPGRPDHQHVRAKRQLHLA
jgi:hypothetical protein